MAFGARRVARVVRSVRLSVRTLQAIRRFPGLSGYAGTLGWGIPGTSHDCGQLPASWQRFRSTIMKRPSRRRFLKFLALRIIHVHVAPLGEHPNWMFLRAHEELPESRQEMNRFDPPCSASVTW